MVTPDLLNYVRTARKRGMSDVAIMQSLVQVGWDEASAQEGLYSDKSQQPMQQAEPDVQKQQTSPIADAATPSSGFSQQEIHTAGEVVPPETVSSEETPLAFWTRGIFWSVAGALLIIGVAGGAFAYYAISKAPQHESVSSSKKVATTTPLFPVTSPSTPTASTGKASTPTGNGPASCRANDMKCFIVATRTCTPTKMEWTVLVNMFGLTYGGKGLFTLAHANTPTLCQYSERTESMRVTISPEELQKMKASGITSAQAKQHLVVMNTQAQKGVGITVTCTMSQTQIVSILTKMKNGEFSSSEFPPDKCTTSHSSGSTNGKSTVSYPTGEMTPETVAGMTVFLYLHEDDAFNGLEFKVLSLTASKLSVLITDHNTGKSATEDFIPGQVKTVAGRSMTLKSITLIKDGTDNGKPSYDLQAKLWYHPYLLK